MSHAVANPTTAATGSELLAWLRRQPRRNLLLVALLPVLVVLWLPLLGGSAANRAPASAPAAAAPADAFAAAPLAETAAPTAPTAPAAAAIAATLDFEARVKKLVEPYRPRWSGAAPPPAGQAAAAAPAPRSDAAAWSALVPTMILLSRGGAPIAIVQGRTCRVGDTVNGRTIVAIEERRVVYRDGDNTITAAMASSPPGERR